MKKILFLNGMGILFLVTNVLASSAGAQLDPYVAAYDEQNPTAPILLQAVKSQNPQDRFRAALAYGRILKPESAQPLIGLSKDSSQDV